MLSLVLVGALEEIVDVQQSVEAGFLNAQEPRSTLAGDRGGAGLVRDESKLSEIVPDAVVHHARAVFRGECGPLLNDVELGTNLPLGHDGGPVGEDFWLEGVGQLRALVGVHAGQERDLREEGVVAVALLLGRFLHDVVEGVAVELPTDTRALAHHRGSARAVVEEGELAEDVADGACLNDLVVHDAVELTGLDDEQEVTGVALDDDLLLLGHLDLLHGADDDSEVVVVQIGEQEGLGKDLLQTLLLLVRLGDHGRHECLLLVPLTVGLSRHGLTGLSRHLSLEVRWRLIVVIVLLLLLILLFGVARGEFGALLHLGLDPVDLSLQLLVFSGQPVFLLGGE
mmetsp:Transcript_69188/g.144508  ORF Transcript_69188/g.144508 Transcript_69188/m.144508 type:complete len:341 (-) Transcript_69188:293-1315(-)